MENSRAWRCRRAQAGAGRSRCRAPAHRDDRAVRPTGIVWLQHAFFQTKDNLVALAQSIAANTGAIVVAPTITSNPLATGGCWINGPPMARAVADLFVAEPSALQTSAGRGSRRPHMVTAPVRAQRQLGRRQPRHRSGRRHRDAGWRYR
jgi:hypothetical protein